MSTTHYKTDWTFDACGCVAPTDVYVYEDGRAVAVYDSEPEAPYASLHTLIEAHNAESGTTFERLRAGLEETDGGQPPDWSAVLERARSYYGPMAVRGLK